MPDRTHLHSKALLDRSGIREREKGGDGMGEGEGERERERRENGVIGKSEKNNPEFE